MRRPLLGIQKLKDTVVPQLPRAAADFCDCKPVTEWAVCARRYTSLLLSGPVRADRLVISLRLALRSRRSISFRLEIFLPATAAPGSGEPIGFRFAIYLRAAHTSLLSGPVRADRLVISLRLARRSRRSISFRLEISLPAAPGSGEPIGFRFAIYLRAAPRSRRPIGFRFALVLHAGS